MTRLILPYPVSANRYWRTYMPRGFKAPVTTLSAEAKAFRAEVVRLARVAGVTKPIDGRVAVTVALYPNQPQDHRKRKQTHGDAWDDTVQCIDLDNALKVLIDAIKGVVITDDKWVRRIVAERFEPDGTARVVLHVEQVEPASPQLAIDIPPAPKLDPRGAKDDWVDPFQDSVACDRFVGLAA